MNALRVAGAVLAALCLSSCSPEKQPTEAPGGQPPAQTSSISRDLPIGSGFDFYVLSLSWSPSYCKAEGDEANQQQCASGKAHGFVVHGLWPQFSKGYPESCQSSEPARVPNSLVSRYLDLLPSAGLIGHQWRKHGTCSGLTQEDYFETIRQARDRIVMPDSIKGGDDISPLAIEDAVIAVNPGLTRQSIAVDCGDGLIQEVRICLTRDLKSFQSCPEVDRRGCRRPADMPPVQ